MRDLKKAFKRDIGWVRQMFTLPNLLMAVALFFFMFSPIFAEIRDYLDSNSMGLGIFIGVFIIVCVFTWANYYKTLGPFEEETKESGPASRKNVKIWTAFWVIWSVYCSVLVLKLSTFNWQLFITISILAVVPGCLAFLFSWKVRSASLKEGKELNEKYGAKHKTEEPYYIFTDRKYHSGYCGLVCIPVYVIITLAGYIIKHLV